MKKSFDSGILPLNWQRVNISAIFKKGRRDDPLNYRPISLTSVICKLLEKTLKQNLLIIWNPIICFPIINTALGQIDFV